MGSSRLPGKILMPILGKEMLLYEICRVLNAKLVDAIVVATTAKKEDDRVEALVNSLDNPRVSVYRGSEEDVLDRYYRTAKKHGAEAVVRITGDCPLIDWEVMDAAVSEFKTGKYDYVSNILPKRTYPRGLDVEVFGFKTLEHMWWTCKEKREREHVTTYIREHADKFRIKNIVSKEDLSGLRWTVDEANDFLLVERIFAELYPKNKNFKSGEVLNLLKAQKGLIGINRSVEQKKNIKNEAN